MAAVSVIAETAVAIITAAAVADLSIIGNPQCAADTPGCQPRCFFKNIFIGLIAPEKLGYPSRGFLCLLGIAEGGKAEIAFAAFSEPYARRADYLLFV